MEELLLKRGTLEGLVAQMLSVLGEDPKREGLQQTPRRVAKAFEFLTDGYRQDVEKVLNGAIFNESYS